MLLRALALVPDSRLLILGQGEEREALVALAAELGITSRVDFVGFVTNPLPYIRAAAGLILSSTYEGFGNVLVEALGCGTPVVSTDCPYGPSEILDGGRYGQLVPVGNHHAMAEAIRRMPTWNAEQLRRRADEFTVQRAIYSYVRLLTR